MISFEVVVALLVDEAVPAVEIKEKHRLSIQLFGHLIESPYARNLLEGERVLVVTVDFDVVNDGTRTTMTTKMAIIKPATIATE